MSSFAQSGLEHVYDTFFDWSYIKAVLPELIVTGWPNTLLLAIASALLALVMAWVMVILDVTGCHLVRLPVRVYVSVFRGLPVILTVLLVGQGLPMAGISPFGPGSYPYAIAALGMVNAAYLCEIFRSGIQSVDAVLLEASLTLGLSRRSAMVRIMVPLGIRNMQPAIANQLIVIIKESSLVYLLGLLPEQRDLFSIAQDHGARTGTLSALVAAGCIYLATTVPLTALIDRLDRRFRAV
ncbi:amino acid ABC transporter permease [Streptomyces sp. NRRL F-2664]|uniref:amino acid ABC transporter permease n=1 Tax=Streptomyces sp. NRRL F-2664 TaxID=1463842 RepID=UPI00068C6976|nr:ABC transporter permease subunit [Streptomyces sp. NRRL F-2664]